MELFYWCGKPSEDPHCLAALVYVRMAKADVKLTPCHHPSASPSGKLPCLRSDGMLVDGLDSILAHLRGKSYNVDHGLSRLEQTEAVALSAFVKQRLHSVMQYNLWCDDGNYGTYTYGWYGRNVSFPRNFWYAAAQQRHVKRSLMALFGASDLSLVKESVYSQARECLNMLSSRLENQKFFFGDRPSSLDAMVFAYLFLMHEIPLVQCPMKAHIQACPPLCSFISHIRDDFTRDVPSSIVVTCGESQSLVRRMRHKQWWLDNHVNVASVVFAGTAMLSYAAFRGLIWRSSS